MEHSLKSSALLDNQAKAPQQHSRNHWLRSTKAKRLFSFCRWLHIYISCALFCLLLFFCITGVTLNHPNWTADTHTEIHSIALPKSIALDDNGEYQIKSIQRFIENKTGLSSPRSVDIAIDMGEITYDYPLPSGYAFVTVILAENIIEIEQASNGFIGLLNDLHKGRHSGNFWSVVIDASAILMSFFTLTGLIILFQNAKHRKQAFIIVLLGSITPIAIYLLAVPRL